MAINDRGNLFRLMSRSGLSLFLFAVLGVGVVTFFHVLTAERIEKNEREYMMRSLNELIPASAYDNDFFTDTIDVIDEELLGIDQGVAVYRARRQGQPVGLIISPQAPNGYNGVIRLLVGIYADGTLAGVRVVAHRETPGLGDGIDQQRSDWVEQFSGLPLASTPAADWQVKKDGGRFDQLTEQRGGRYVRAEPGRLCAIRVSPVRGRHAVRCVFYCHRPGHCTGVAPRSKNLWRGYRHTRLRDPYLGRVSGWGRLRRAVYEYDDAIDRPLHQAAGLWPLMTAATCSG